MAIDWQVDRVVQEDIRLSKLTINVFDEDSIVEDHGAEERPGENTPSSDNECQGLYTVIILESKAI